jgi:hypothetical protein
MSRTFIEAHTGEVNRKQFVYQSKSRACSKRIRVGDKILASHEGMVVAEGEVLCPPNTHSNLAICRRLKRVKPYPTPARLCFPITELQK